MRKRCKIKGLGHYYIHLKEMYYDFERAYKVVEIELKYQNGEMNENHVYKEIDKLYDELRENKEAIVVSGSSPE